MDKRKNIADEEINKLYALRQVLVEKNLAGTYSDEIFKEQNAAIESKIVAAQAAKNDGLIDQYNMGKLEEFIKAKLANLAVTYVDSDLSQIRCLLGSIFLSGITWDYPGISNREISPCYQAIRECDKGIVPFGEPSGQNLEHHFFDNLLSTYQKLTDFGFTYYNKKVVIVESSEEVISF